MLDFKIGAIGAQKLVPTQTPIDPRRTSDTAANPKIHRVEVYWTAVTYKTVAVYIILGAAIIFGVLYVVSPNLYQNTIKKISTAIDNSDSEAVAASQTQAKFVNLDGKVLVKKVNSVQWVQADFHTTLDKGDLVQTGPEGVARITFGDRTSYTVKPDTLITVEENVMASNKPTSVAVRINTGSVDLATPNWTSPDSKAAVSVEDSTAQLASNSRAAVKADPDTKENEIVMARGSAEVQRGGERIELAQFQKATLPKGGPHHQDRRARAPRTASASESGSDHRRKSETDFDPFRMETRAGRGFLHAAHQHDDDVHQEHQTAYGDRHKR